MREKRNASQIEIQVRFGAAIRRQRQGIGLSQEELAARAGLHRTYLADVERGSRNVALQNIERIAAALNLSLSSLFADCEGEGERENEI